MVLRRVQPRRASRRRVAGASPRRTSRATDRFPFDATDNLYSGKLTWNVASSTTVVGTVFADPSTTSGAAGADPRQGLGAFYVTPIVSPDPSTWYSARDQGGTDYGVRLTQLFGSQAIATLQGSYHQDKNSLTAPDGIRYDDWTCGGGTPGSALRSPGGAQQRHRRVRLRSRASGTDSDSQPSAVPGAMSRSTQGTTRSRRAATTSMAGPMRTDRLHGRAARPDPERVRAALLPHMLPRGRARTIPLRCPSSHRHAGVRGLRRLPAGLLEGGARPHDQRRTAVGRREHGELRRARPSFASRTLAAPHRRRLGSLARRRDEDLCLCRTLLLRPADGAGGGGLRNFTDLVTYNFDPVSVVQDPNVLGPRRARSTAGRRPVRRPGRFRRAWRPIRTS